MNYSEIKSFFDESISYKKGWKFFIGKKGETIYLQIQFEAPDNETGVPEQQFCRKWQLSEFMTKTELVRSAFSAVLQAEKHEAEEIFRYNGKDIFNSHLDVDALAEVCAAGRYEHRPEPTK